MDPTEFRRRVRRQYGWTVEDPQMLGILRDAGYSPHEVGSVERKVACTAAGSKLRRDSLPVAGRALADCRWRNDIRQETKRKLAGLGTRRARRPRRDVQAQSQSPPDTEETTSGPPPAPENEETTSGPRFTGPRKRRQARGTKDFGRTGERLQSQIHKRGRQCAAQKFTPRQAAGGNVLQS